MDQHNRVKFSRSEKVIIGWIMFSCLLFICRQEQAAIHNILCAIAVLLIAILNYVRQIYLDK